MIQNLLSWIPCILVSEDPSYSPESYVILNQNGQCSSREDIPYQRLHPLLILFASYDQQSCKAIRMKHDRIISLPPFAVRFFQESMIGGKSVITKVYSIRTQNVHYICKCQLYYRATNDYFHTLNDSTTFKLSTNQELQT